MTRLITVAAFLCLFAIPAGASELTYCAKDQTYRQTCVEAGNLIQSHAKISTGDPRPRAWCGWWLRQQLNVADRSGNLARWWRGYGSNARGPAIGAIVVWSHHVGIITGKSESGWVVKSGNDGNAVRERERSLRGAIAFRWPGQVAGL